MRAKHFKHLCSKSGIQTSSLSLFCRHIECERNLMAQRPAPLNMNKPSSAEIQAKPNSARRHHSRTEQEALELLLASTTKLHSPTPSLPTNSHSWSQLPIKKKRKKVKSLKKSCSDFFFLMIVRMTGTAYRRRYCRLAWIPENTGEAGGIFEEKLETWCRLLVFRGLRGRDDDWKWWLFGSCCFCFKGSWINVRGIWALFLWHS